MNQIYIVKYSEGSYEDWCATTVFATTNKSKATKYVTRFNSILRKWRNHYSQYEYLKYKTMIWIRPEYSEKWFKRWHKLSEINKCYYETVEIR